MTGIIDADGSVVDAEGVVSRGGQFHGRLGGHGVFVDRGDGRVGW